MDCELPQRAVQSNYPDRLFRNESSTNLTSTGSTVRSCLMSLPPRLFDRSPTWKLPKSIWTSVASWFSNPPDRKKHTRLPQKTAVERNLGKLARRARVPKNKNLSRCPESADNRRCLSKRLLQYLFGSLFPITLFPRPQLLIQHMETPPDKRKTNEDTLQDGDDFDDYDGYGEYVADSIGLSLRKRPSAKQKSAIVKEIKNQNHGEESDVDYDSIFVEHARDCFDPLYFTEPKVFSRVENILRSFLPADHPMSDDLSLNKEDPPLCIRQLLKKPTVEQLAQVIKAFKEHDPDWCWYDAGEGARKLVLALGHNFPELIKQNSRNKIIFGDNFQDSDNRRPPPVPKAKRGNRGRGILVVVVIFLVIFWVFNSFR